MWRLGNTVFLPQPRAASTAIWAWMKENGGEIIGSTHHAVEPVPEGCRSFSIVRNPYDLLVSAWHQKKNPERENFDHWLRMTLSGRGQMFGDGPLIYGHLFWKHQPPADIIIRYENLERDLPMLLPGVRLSNPNKSVRRPYRQYYNREQQLKVERQLLYDLDFYGYSF